MTKFERVVEVLTESVVLGNMGPYQLDGVIDRVVDQHFKSIEPLSFMEVMQSTAHPGAFADRMDSLSPDDVVYVALKSQTGAWEALSSHVAFCSLHADVKAAVEWALSPRPIM